MKRNPTKNLCYHINNYSLQNYKECNKIIIYKLFITLKIKFFNFGFSNSK